MGYAADTQLKLMARSLQEHIGLANELNLRFTAQLLAMAVMEITTNIHGISQAELDALCERVAQKSSQKSPQKSSYDARPAVMSSPDFRSYNRRPRARRNRSM
jgi:hypothetical protein